MNYVPMFRSFEMVGGNEENGKKSYENVFTPGDILVLSAYSKETLKRMFDYRKQTEEINKPGFILVVDNLDKAEEGYKNFIKEIVNNYVSAANEVFGQHTPILIFQYKSKINGLLDYLGFELLESHEEDKFKYIDSLTINTLNKDIPLKQVKQHVDLSPSAQNVFKLLYGIEGDSENSYGISSKFGNYLVFNKHLPEGVVCIINNIDEDFKKIENMLRTNEQDLKVIKPSFGHRAGGYVVVPYVSKKRLKSQIKKLMNYCEEQKLEPVFVVQKGEKPFLFNIEGDYYGAFIRPYKIDNNKLLYAIKISGRGVKNPENITKEFSRGKSEYNLSGGNTISVILEYDIEKENYKILTNSSKKGRKIIEGDDLRNLYVKFKNEEKDFDSFLSEITPVAENMIKTLDDNIRKVVEILQKDPEFLLHKKEEVKKALNEKT